MDTEVYKIRIDLLTLFLPQQKNRYGKMIRN